MSRLSAWPVHLQGAELRQGMPEVVGIKSPTKLPPEDRWKYTGSVRGKTEMPVYDRATP